MSKNGYSISYYYGGNAAFDGQDEYLSSNGVSFVAQPKDEDFDQENKETMLENNAWGLYDGDVFKAAMKRKDTIGDVRPFTDIYLPLSAHEPFYFKGIESYKKRVVEMLENNPDVPERERKTIMDNTHVYACFLYLDDCMRMLFDYYKRQPGFENTVFVITGDHRMGRLYINKSELLKYSVPFIIYSPLVKNPKLFKSVITHHDITPTINSYLSNNYDYKTDSVCHWLGTSMDTTAEFSSDVKVAFMRNNREVFEYLYYDTLIVRNRLFKIGDDMYPNEINDTAALNRIEGYLSAYKKIDHYVTQNDYLVTKPTDKLDNVVRQGLDMDKLISNDEKPLVNGFESDTIEKHMMLEMYKDKYYHVFSSVKFDKDYEKVYIDFVCDYKILEKSKADDFKIVFKITGGKGASMWKGYIIENLSSEIVDDKEGFKRLRVKTTCFFPKPATEGAVLNMYFISKEDMPM